MKKILAVNIIVVLVLFGLCEIISYFYLKNDAKEFFEAYNKSAKEKGEPLLSQRYAKVKYFGNENFKNRFRPILKGADGKGSIILFGCSYSYGSGLTDEQTLSYYINKYSDRTVINRGIPAGGPYNMLKDLKSAEFISSLKTVNKPEYIIYLYINDHLNRLFNPYMGSVFNTSEPYYKIRTMYKRKNGIYVEEKPSKINLLFYSLQSVRAYFYFLSQSISGEKGFDKLIDVLVESKNEAEKEFPGVKFIILKYKDGSHVLINEYTENRLKEKGFTVLDAEMLAGHELESFKWRGNDKEHPNARAFDDVAKGLAKALDL